MSTPPIRRSVVVNNEFGLHLRPADQLANTARQFASQIRVICHEQQVDAKSTIDLLTLGARKGTELVFEAEGADAQAAVDALVEFMESGFSQDLEPTE